MLQDNLGEVLYVTNAYGRGYAVLKSRKIISLACSFQQIWSHLLKKFLM